MEIKIELKQEEALKIIYEYFKPMFPGKFIYGDIESYGDVVLEVKEKEREVKDGE